MLRNPIRLATIVAVLALSLSFAPSVRAAPAACATRANHTPALLLECVTVEGVREHQAAFQAIADANGGTRLSGTSGYDRSVDYVVERMTAAGYNVTLNSFPFVFVPPVVLQQTAQSSVEYESLSATGTGFGTVSAAVTAIDVNLVPPRANTSGCQGAFTEAAVGAPIVPDPGGPDDFAGFAAGNIALLQRGGCSFGLKAINAEAAGAGAMILFNQGNTAAPDRNDLFGATLGGTNIVDIPVVTASYADGETLAQAGVEATVSIGQPQDVTVQNVLAESRGGDPNNVVMVGAHLDSVSRGPGINDNGSGSGALLEVAEQMAKVKPVNKVRFAWWGAEEAGLVGSIAYVNGLSQAERDKIALYLNFDMVGSPNHVFFIYDGDDSDAEGAGPGPAGSAEIEKTFERYFNSVNQPFKGTDFSGRSDYGPFIATGIPAGGLFTGAEGIKTAEEAAIWGGTAGISYDPCYHLPCDTYDNVNLDALDINSDAIAYATIQNAMNAVELAQASDELQAILDANPGTSLADKVEDVLAKVQSASAELSKSPPDLQAVLGNIEGAVGDLEAAVKEGLDAAQGLHLTNLLTSSARQFASGAINEAVAQNGNRGKIREAQRSLAEGDALRASGKSKDAVSKYKDALSKAQGARR